MEAIHNLRSWNKGKLVGQQGGRFLTQYRNKSFYYLGQKPGQRYFDAQGILQDFDARGGRLAERAHAEAQRIALPGCLINRDHGAELAAGAGEAFAHS